MKKLPPKGKAFTAYKQVITMGRFGISTHYVLTLRGPASAERVMPNEAKNVWWRCGAKVRVSQAKPVKAEKIENWFASPRILLPTRRINFLAVYDESKWALNETRFPDSFDPNPKFDCSNGLHCFLTKKEAKEW